MSITAIIAAGYVSLNESPSQKEGKSKYPSLDTTTPMGLNESPSQKEGKSADSALRCCGMREASMKALPKRKGNVRINQHGAAASHASMKALPKRKGNGENCG